MYVQVCKSLRGDIVSLLCPFHYGGREDGVCHNALTSSRISSLTGRATLVGLLKPKYSPLCGISRRPPPLGYPGHWMLFLASPAELYNHLVRKSCSLPLLPYLVMKKRKHTDVETEFSLSPLLEETPGWIPAVSPSPATDDRKM